MNSILTIKELIKKLNCARNEYYNNNIEIMTNKEYDDLFDKLIKLENESQVFLSNSPTQSVGYEVKSKLNKVEHETPLLSLAKTKDINDIYKFIKKDKTDFGCLAMYKLDGLTTELIYENGKLVMAKTRGNGTTGEDILHNVKQYSNVPLEIPYKERLRVSGESYITYSQFNEINNIENTEYKNPRNLASGTIRQLNSEICKNRNVKFNVFDVLEGFKDIETKHECFVELKNMGFEICKYYGISKTDTNLEEIVDYVINNEKEIPIDGMVITYNSREFCKSLGNTSHHFNSGIAYKFKDDSVETTLLDILVDIGKSGQVSYTALFEPVDIDGAMIEKATLHNYEYIKELELGIGDSIEIIRANMVIPQLVANNTRSNTYEKATICPVCGSKLENKGVHQFCTNYMCERQLIGRLTHWCSRDALNIDSLSEKTIQSMYDNLEMYEGKIFNTVADLYAISNNIETLQEMDGFGKRKVEKIVEALESSKTMPLNNVLYGLSIPQVGKTASKTLANYFKNIDNILNKQYDMRTITDLVGDSVGKSFINNFVNSEEMNKVITLLKSYGLTMEMPQEDDNSSKSLEGLTFVVTGSVNVYSNRKELQADIEKFGGKCSGSVSKNTNYLINNDVESNSGKNKKAKELGVDIITEQEFIEIIS